MVGSKSSSSEKKPRFEATKKRSPKETKIQTRKITCKEFVRGKKPEYQAFFNMHLLKPSSPARKTKEDWEKDFQAFKAEAR